MNRYFVSVCLFALTLVSAQAMAEDAWREEIQALRSRLAQQDKRLAAQDKRISQQDAEMATMRSSQGQTWLNERRAEQVKTLVREVLADADTRASLAEGGTTAGWNKGFYLASEDGNFLLRMFGLIQTRYTLSTADNAYNNGTTTDIDNNRGGFEISRTRLGFKGHIVDSTWKYFIWAGYNSSGAGFLLDAYITKDLGNGLSVTAGQFKTPLWREWLVSETRQQFIERSLVHNLVSGLYTQGIVLNYKTDQLNAVLSVNDGGQAAFNSPWNNEDVEALAVTARAEYALFGDFSSYADLESWTDEKPSLIIGGAIHWQQGEYGTSGTTLTTGDEADVLRWAVDANLEMGGWNIFAAFTGNHISEAEMVNDLDQFGLIIQGGLFVTEDVELMARYEWGDMDVNGVDELSILTVGFSKFFAKHAAKWNTDLGYSFNSLQSVSVGGNTFTWTGAAQGYQPESDDSDGQIVIRTQLQLLF